ncbi:MAG: methyltransferase domain-containing protein [Oligoflexia bacterium]|nr:methyltransferase domain-containing protein [Oligoflexia bacterium]
MPHSNLKSSRREELYEAEVLDGLVPLFKNELMRKFGRSIEYRGASAPDRLTFTFNGDSTQLLKLRLPVAMFKLVYFKLPRPQSLLQGQAKQIFARELRSVLTSAAKGTFKAFRIGAAGSDSPAFQRIASFIREQTGLVQDQEDGDLVIRFRRSAVKNFGWDMLMRLTARPLSARAWRKENFPGALNACIAAAMLEDCSASSPKRLVNLMCGSGTLLAEAAALAEETDTEIELTGVDINEEVLSKAHKNLATIKAPVKLIKADCARLPFSDQSFEALCADLPWGRRVGEKADLPQLYAATLKEAARIAAPDAKLILITQGIDELEQALQSQSNWQVIKTLRVKQRDYKPKILWLKHICE